MIKKFNKFVWLSVGICSLFTIVGGLLIFFPEISIDIIAYLVSLSLIVLGFILIFDYNGSFLLMNFLPTGLLSIVLGVVILLYPELFAVLIPIIVGVWMIVNSLVNMELCISLIKVKFQGWMLPFLLSLVTIICGILIIVNPENGVVALTTIFGMLMVIYSISNIVSLIIFKTNMNQIAKVLKLKKD